MSALDTEAFPRGALIAMGLVLSLSVGGVAAVRLAGLNTDTLGPAANKATPQRVEALKFKDQADGSVSINDGGDGHLVARLAPGSGAFVRGVMRGLAHDRQVRGLGDSTPFLLKAWPGGQLALEDPATGRQIDLQAFGSTNRDAFLRLLGPQGARS
jgi:putative photosynthetic complex assembly protein